MAEEAEKAAAGRRIGKLYQITRKLYGKRRNTNMPVRDKHGKLITYILKKYLIGQNQQRLLKYLKQKLT